MNFQVLPNWCKKLGVLLFVVFSFLEGRDDFIRGFNEGRESWHCKNNSSCNSSFSLRENGIFSFEDFFGEKTIMLFGAISFIGMIIYMLSKEKIEDDYIKILRLESYQLSSLIIIITSLVIYLFGFNNKIEVATIISILLGLYLIIFAIKKRTV